MMSSKGKGNNRGGAQRNGFRQTAPTPPKAAGNKVESLLDAMVDGKEYYSISSRIPKQRILEELGRAIHDVESTRGRPALLYLANTVRPLGMDSAITAVDEIPINEMVRALEGHEEIDIILVTPGGDGTKVRRFVDLMRSRFKKISFILPFHCMSAGTIWVCSGDELIMTESASMGPIDPQFPTKSGNFAPAQSLWEVIEKIREAGEKFIKKGQPIPWNLQMMINNIDWLMLGNADKASEFATTAATEFLEKYKFSDWTHHDGDNTRPVSQDAKHKKAEEIAGKLCDNKEWKSHGYMFSRQRVWDELRIKVTRAEDVPGLDRALKRLWALVYYYFDRGVHVNNAPEISDITKIYSAAGLTTLKMKIRKV